MRSKCRYSSRKWDAVRILAYLNEWDSMHDNNISTVHGKSSRQTFLLIVRWKMVRQTRNFTS